MQLPKVPVTKGRTERDIIVFGGLDWRQEPDEGTLADSRGLSAGRYPALGQRGGRGVYGTYLDPTAIFAREKLCVVDGTDFLYDGEKVGTVIPGAKEMSVVNTKLCIFPDKRYFDLESREFGELEASLTALEHSAVFTENTLQFSPNPKMDEVTERYGRNYSSPYRIKLRYYDSAPVWQNGAWVKGTAQEAQGTAIAGENAPDKLKGKYIIPSVNEYGNYYLPLQFSTDPYEPENQNGVYGVITATSYEAGENAEYWEVTAQLYDGASSNVLFTAVFKKGDGIEITGCTTLKGNNKSAVIREVSDTTLTFDSGIFSSGSEAGTVTVKRPVPDLEYICEVDNRLWGCCGTTIYASALGDPGNFYVYDGLSTDGYAVAVGTEGPFTGCIGYSSGALFFKENCVHKLLGTSPKNYQMNTLRFWGVQKGSHRSLCTVNEVLYYKGVTGVFAYTGGTPVCISECFGNRRFAQAAGGSDGARYYLSMMDEEGNWGFFSYDIQSGVWLREDETHAIQFATVDGKAHYLAGDTVFLCGEGDFSGVWSARLNPLTEQALGKKRYTRLTLRLELEEGAWVRVETRTDGGQWRQVWLSPAGRRRVFAVPLRPTRCDRMELRLSGEGVCIVRTLERSFDVGEARG